jgi:hypothetical protein
MKWHTWLLLSVLAVVGVYELATIPPFPRCPLTRYGLDYRTEGGASPSYDAFLFYLKDNPEKIKCPFFDGFELHLRFADVDGDGIEEIIVTRDGDPKAISVVKALVKDGKVTGFRVLKEENIEAIFSENAPEPKPTPSEAKGT